MTQEPEPATAGLGHNQPPEPTMPEPRTLEDEGFLARVLAAVKSRHKPIFDRMAELTQSFESFPEVISTEHIAGEADDLLKMMRAIRKRADEFRKIETAPYRTLRTMVDTAFSTPDDDLAKLQKALTARVEVYSTAKAAREKAEREAKAKADREEAERKLKQAAEDEARAAEERRRAAVAEAERIAAQAAKEAAERAASVALKRKRRLEKLGPYLAQRAEREAKRRNLAQAEAERHAQEAEASRIAAIAAAEAERVQQKATAAAARKDEGAAKGAREDALEAAGDAEVDSAAGLTVALKQEVRADRADRHALAPLSEMSVTKGRLGSRSSLATTWEVSDVDHSVVPLDKLRGYLNPEAIDAAVFKYLLDHRLDPGGPKLEGCEFRQVEGLRVT